MAKAARPTLRFVDRLVLVVAWLVTCGLVYVLGFYLGRGTQDHQVAFEERTVRLPVTSTPPPEGQHPKEGKEFPSFYETLPGGSPQKELARQAAVTTTTAAPVTPLSTRVSTTTRAPTPSTATSLRGSTTTWTPPAPTSTTFPPRGTPPPTFPPPAPPTPPTTIARPAPPVPRPSGGSWSVEAAPTRSRAEAEQLLGTLRKRGYDAEMVSVQRDGDTWYRLRVGRYATAEQANEVMRRLRDVEGVSHAFVASE